MDSAPGRVLAPGALDLLQSARLAPLAGRGLGLGAQDLLDEVGHRPGQEQVLLVQRGAEAAVAVAQRAVVAPTRASAP